MDGFVEDSTVGMRYEGMDQESGLAIVLSKGHSGSSNQIHNRIHIWG